MKSNLLQQISLHIQYTLQPNVCHSSWPQEAKRLIAEIHLTVIILPSKVHHKKVNRLLLKALVNMHQVARFATFAKRLIFCENKRQNKQQDKYIMNS